MRAMLVNHKNNYLDIEADGHYHLSVDLSRFTGAVTTGAVFAMRNQVAASNNKVIALSKINAHLAHTAAGNAQSVQVFWGKRFSTATHSGGSSILTSIAKHRSDGPASVLLDARIADITGTSPLTDTSVVYDSPFRSRLLPRTVGSSVVSLWSTSEHDKECFLLPGEGFALIIKNTAVAGDGILLDLEWDEYDKDLISTY